MHVAFVNPQGNFDPEDSYWTAHPDFGGQLVYVKELALAMGNLGHKVDIVTRRIIDPDWPEFASDTDAYPDAPNVRILRIPCGPDTFLPKEELWPYLGTEFVPRLLELYEREGSLPDAVTSHYGDGGLCAALIEERTGIPFSFTAHSLGAQKMDKMGIPRDDIAQVDARYHFSSRIVAERLAMNRSSVNVTSTCQERFNQYTHNAYRGAVDPSDDARFAAVPPGVALHIFDKSARYEDEEAVQRTRRDVAGARPRAPERIGLPCVVASSRLDPKKNHLALVEAFAGSPTLRESANLVILTGSLENPARRLRCGQGRGTRRPRLPDGGHRPGRDAGRGLHVRRARPARPRGRLPLPRAAALRLRAHGALRAVRAGPAGGDGRGPPRGRHQVRRTQRVPARGRRGVRHPRRPGRPRRRRGRPARPDEQPRSVGALRRGRLRPRARPLHLGEHRRRIPRGHLGRKKRRRGRA